MRLLLRVFRDVLQALAYLHNRIPEAVIHLDIKVVIACIIHVSISELVSQPDNVFVFEVDGSIQVKIGDVDCARFSSKSGHLSSRHGGAPMFAAPDLFMGQFSTKVDVFRC